MKTIILYHSKWEENFPDRDLPLYPALRQSAVARSKLTGFALHSTQGSENLPLETANLFQPMENQTKALCLGKACARIHNKPSLTWQTLLLTWSQILRSLPEGSGGFDPRTVISLDITSSWHGIVFQWTCLRMFRNVKWPSHEDTRTRRYQIRPIERENFSPPPALAGDGSTADNVCQGYTALSGPSQPSTPHQHSARAWSQLSKSNGILT